MRKFKNVAVASATALALTLSGTAVASAQDIVSQEDVQQTGLSSGSSEWGVWLNGDEKADGQQGFGEKLDSDAPAWIKFWNVGLYTLAGGIIGGAVLAGFNWLKHEGIII
ncbi:hypothetical protein CKALI_00600 [Corynebacterium kalinowskii]|uniref:Or membrane protein n=1 Tax=Corynebacterium kalinowskii TaxID=2675216 RepID=A0A6B8VMQ9_9CORY|nr:hypothetical protein [Corynebacterium kalinowskii]QGU01021.1 hypothetical protein CKALI_00600 [Corynebacterium kalinowskii]